jgi:hypothetical protein
MEIESKQDLLDVLAPEETPEQAEQHLPVALAECENRREATEAAKKLTAKCQAALDHDDETLRYLTELRARLSAELAELRATSRTELFALQKAFDVEEVSSLMRRKSGTVEYVDREYDFLLTVKRGADEILLRDAIANQDIAEATEVSGLAVLSRLRTIIALGPVIASEGDCGFIGSATEKLREEAKALAKKAETSRAAAREARATYERQQSARISRGIITSLNMPNAAQH